VTCLLSAVCGCGHGADANTEELTALSVAYQKAVEVLVASGRYDGKDDFTVVSQTFFKETTPPPKVLTLSLLLSLDNSLSLLLSHWIYLLYLLVLIF